MLSHERINELAALPGVKRVAVKNFLSSLVGMAYDDACENLGMDAPLYKWNEETVDAISTGLREAYGILPEPVYVLTSTETGVVISLSEIGPLHPERRRIEIHLDVAHRDGRVLTCQGEVVIDIWGRVQWEIFKYFDLVENWDKALLPLVQNLKKALAEWGMQYEVVHE